MTKVFFSFYFTGDYSRTLHIMEKWEKFPETSSVGIIDDDEIDKMADEGFARIYNWIEQKVKESDILICLIGENTAGRNIVEYEIAMAQKYTKPIMGIYVDEITDQDGNKSKRGVNPLLPVFPVYDWFADSVEGKFQEFVNEAIQNGVDNYIRFGEMLKYGVEATRQKFRVLRES